MENKQVRAFVIDDEPAIAKTLANILSLSGFTALGFTNPRKALAAASDNAPDLIISDIVMPELSGIDLAIQLKAMCPDCNILLFSGQATCFALLDEARMLGHSFEVLQKPISPAALLAEIRSRGWDQLTPKERQKA